MTRATTLVLGGERLDAGAVADARRARSRRRRRRRPTAGTSRRSGSSGSVARRQEADARRQHDGVGRQRRSSATQLGAPTAGLGPRLAVGRRRWRPGVDRTRGRRRATTTSVTATAAAAATDAPRRRRRRRRASRRARSIGSTLASSGPGAGAVLLEGAGDAVPQPLGRALAAEGEHRRDLAVRLDLGPGPGVGRRGRPRPGAARGRRRRRGRRHRAGRRRVVALGRPSHPLPPSRRRSPSAPAAAA